MIFERGTLNDIFGDYIIFRELNPFKRDLPDFETIKGRLSLKTFPRKKDKEYALVLSTILKEAKDFSNIVYIGDTFMSDLTVIKNLKAYGIDVFGVITDEGATPPESGLSYVRFNASWRELLHFVSPYINSNTVVIVDVDKTAIGAHGRNHLPIDKARSDAIFELARVCFAEPERNTILKLYHSIHTKEFLHFTEDNQDIVSIMTLILYSHLKTFEEFCKIAKEKSFREFIENIEVKEGMLKTFVDEVKEHLSKGSPTIFPTFRRIELEKTIKRMDFLPDATPLDVLFDEEILITGEVYSTGIFAREKGALVFGVSDKPESASISERYTVFTQRMKIYP